MNEYPRRATTYVERATWGNCPVCKAEHGVRCDPNIGIALGRNVNGMLPEDGAHLARLQGAPMYIRLVPA